MKTKFKTRDLTMIAMMGAICCILLHIDFPLPFLPPFMNFDLAGLVEIIGGFAMGPLQAVCIILVKILLKLATEGTSSAFTGELQNFLLSCAYVLPPVGVWTVSQFQCGGPSSQNPYPSKTRWAVTPPTI